MKWQKGCGAKYFLKFPRRWSQFHEIFITTLARAVTPEQETTAKKYCLAFKRVKEASESFGTILKRFSFNFTLRGAQAFNFGNFDFEIWVEGEGQDTSQNFKGGFGSMRTILPMWGVGAKLGPKSKPKDIELWFLHHSIRLEKTTKKQFRDMYMDWKERPGHVPTFLGWFWVHANKDGAKHHNQTS